PPVPPAGKQGTSDPRYSPKSGGSAPSNSQSTFRPNPAASKGAARKSKGKATSDRDAAAFERPEGGPKLWERFLFGRVSSGQLAQFCRQFGSYLSAGVDYTRALSSLERQFAHTALGPVTSRLQVAIRRGANLEEAMAREPNTFGPMFTSMMKV